MYVDNLNFVGTLHEISIATSYLKKEFEMKDLGMTKYCLGILVEHLPAGVFIYQSAYIEKVLEKFGLEKPIG